MQLELISDHQIERSGSWTQKNRYTKIWESLVEESKNGSKNRLAKSYITVPLKFDKYMSVLMVCSELSLTGDDDVFQRFDDIYKVHW